MNHRNGFNPLSRTSAHRRAMSRNMVTSLFKYERITTTKAKALEIKKAAERLITRSKVDSVHNRREVAKFIQDEIILVKLFTVIGPRMLDRPGGYTRVIKLGFRQGDNANMVLLELVDYKLDLDDKKGKKDAKAAKKAAKVEAAEKGDKETGAEDKKAETKKAAPKKAAAKTVKAEAKPAVDKKPAVRKPTARKSAAKGT